MVGGHLLGRRGLTPGRSWAEAGTLRSSAPWAQRPSDGEAGGEGGSHWEQHSQSPVGCGGGDAVRGGGAAELSASQVAGS